MHFPHQRYGGDEPLLTCMGAYGQGGVSGATGHNEGRFCILHRGGGVIEGMH